MKFFKYNIKANIFALLVWAVLLIVIGIALMKASSAKAVNDTNIDPMNSTKENNNCIQVTEQSLSLHYVVKKVVVNHLEAPTTDLNENNNATGTENNTAIEDAIFDVFKEAADIEAEVTDTYGILNNTEYYESTNKEDATSPPVS